MPDTTKHPTAADLAQQCLTAMETKNNAVMGALFHPEARWELSYALDGQSDAERTLYGRQVARFHANMFRIIDSSFFSDVSIDPVSDEAAWLSCRSNAVLVTGDRYGNHYAVRVTARDGLILHWLEFYDPRPAARVRTILGDALRGNAAKP